MKDNYPYGFKAGAFRALFVALAAKDFTTRLRCRSGA